jgi:tRNA nucleotidyltransferase (CCA-adding enzyme)
MQADPATEGLNCFLVGGAVRDQLLNDPVKDRDWVVIGAHADEMLKRGFKRIGRDFPVFLHPVSREEYALARTERKTGPGYHGFDFDAGPEVTLVEDLGRRDLTINAMAMDAEQQLIDPFDGRKDLETRRLRHVSDAFAEDPVRILRVARFAARYQHRGFSVAESTLSMMRKMVENGEADTLVAERIWLDLHKALGEATPSAFVRVLRDCGALARILPELDCLFGVPQPAEHHPEIDTGEHVLLTVDRAAALGAGTEVVFACLVHDLGKALTPAEKWPAHHSHEQLGLKPIAALCERIRVPGNHRELALAVCAQHLNCHRVFELKASTVLKLIESANGLRQQQRLESFLLACQADFQGRTGRSQAPYPQAEFMRRAREAAIGVAVEPLIETGLSKGKLGAALREARIRAIAALDRQTA